MPNVVGVIFCAGYGKRLRPLTYFKPKCMVKVDGKPILEHLFNYLRHYGVSTIIVNTHFKPMQIMKYFGTDLLYFYEPKLLGVEKTLKVMSDKFSVMRESYIVALNGDTLTNLNLLNMANFSHSKSIKSMDGQIFTGQAIYSPDYVQGFDKKISEYRQADIDWIDIGTFEGLGRARKEYEKFNYLPKL
jgi:dTDP-glucose pyrophosphorylase